jgi:hypothetical protein
MQGAATLRACSRSQLEEQASQAAQQQARMMDSMRSTHDQELVAVHSQLSHVQAEGQAHKALAAQLEAQVGS